MYVVEYTCEGSTYPLFALIMLIKRDAYVYVDEMYAVRLNGSIQQEPFCLFAPSNQGSPREVASLQRMRSLRVRENGAHDIEVTFAPQPSSHTLEPCNHELEVRATLDLSPLESWQRATFEETR